MRRTAYLASPYGFAESTRHFYTDRLLPVVRSHVDVIDPWEADLPDADERAERWLALGEFHLRSITERADLVVACLDQEPPDNGTVVEVAWAAAHGRPVVAYRNDLRQGGEEGLSYNLMIGAVVRRSGGLEVTSLDELDRALGRMATPV
ncbi:nucleoside 2-deoxyribosyltransferase [Actinomycetospora endophytica]|uniref:Nucleoside 2-deoxyribosyltransferase n=1 Tax=Actinomycetospora endophytica TaxID=2291215 RepID=A0ABS8PL72_9PSEU|nr:nucleoside 2-deoxyribosyltransferase [Actinomycetospora endophytica]MCD2198230.1 nucleoside 2-deoxyribosyltransferase [Actinomycetospora endophytica]